MTGSERRQKILSLIKESSAPISSVVLCEKLMVSRQTITHDIAILRSLGNEIHSTSKGYYFKKHIEYIRIFHVHHNESQIEEELNLIVDLGGSILNIAVNHEVYGKISVPMNIKSRRDVRIFINQLTNGISSHLSTLTSGYHTHSVFAENTEILDEIEEALRLNNFLVEISS